MNYNHEPIVRAYQAMDANLAVEKEILKLDAEILKNVPGRYQLSQNPSCYCSTWRCSTSLIIYPQPKEEQMPAMCTGLMRYFDQKFKSWERDDEKGWVKETDKYGSRWSRAFTVNPEGWDGGDIKMSVLIFDKIEKDD